MAVTPLVGGQWRRSVVLPKAHQQTWKENAQKPSLFGDGDEDEVFDQDNENDEKVNEEEVHKEVEQQVE